jgi:hypothetical protein
MAHEIASITTCRICGKKFVGPAGSGLLLGTSPRAGQFLFELVNHLTQDHASQDRGFNIRAGEFLGFLRLRTFMSADTAVTEQIDYLRWQVQQETLAAQVHDDALEKKSREFAAEVVAGIMEEMNFAADETSYYATEGKHDREKLVQAVAEQVFELAAGFRDIFQEPGKYQDRSAGKSPIVTN